jgi:hypothetical protein
MFEFSSCQSNGTLHSDLMYSTINASQSKVYFNDLYINGTGMYVLLANIKSADNDFDMNCFSNEIWVKSPDLTLALEDSLPPNMFVKIDANYDSYINKSREIKSMFHNCFLDNYNLVRTRSIQMYRGSIQINTAITASNPGMIASLANDLISGAFSLGDGFSLNTVTIFDKTLFSSPSPSVNVVSQSTGV